MIQTTINTALASFGMSGKVFHGPLLKVHNGFRVKKILERSHTFSKKMFPEAGIVKSFPEILNDPVIDLVVVNTPDQLHFNMAHEALDAGKHVVVEKPFTLTSEEGKILIKKALEKHKVLTVFQNRRWDCGFRTVQKILQEGKLGQVVEYEAHFDRFKENIQPDSWKESESTGTNLLYNLGSHLIDQALVLFGWPHAVFADLRHVRPNSSIIDYFHIHLYYPDLKVILKSSYKVKEPGPKFMVHGTHGSFIKYGLDPQEEALAEGMVPGEPGWGEEIEENYGILNTSVEGYSYNGVIKSLPGSYNSFYDNLYNVINHDEEPLVKAEEALRVIRIIELAMESAKAGRIIKNEVIK